MRKSYVTVKISNELAKKLDVIRKREVYHSRAEVVNDAIRRYVEYKKTKKA
jgi:metal-responsive CopG/Arc/MetJ family transcriptional regulator